MRKSIVWSSETFRQAVLVDIIFQLNFSTDIKFFSAKDFLIFRNASENVIFNIRSNFK